MPSKSDLFGTILGEVTKGLGSRFQSGNSGSGGDRQPQQYDNQGSGGFNSGSSYNPSYPGQGYSGGYSGQQGGGSYPSTGEGYPNQQGGGFQGRGYPGGPPQQPGGYSGQSGPGGYSGQSGPGGYPGQPGGYPGQPGGYPGQSGGFPGQSGGYPGQTGGYPGQPGGYPGQAGGFPGQPGGYPGQGGGFPGQPGGYPNQAGGYPNQPGGYPGQMGGGSGSQGGYPGQQGGYPAQSGAYNQPGGYPPESNFVSGHPFGSSFQRKLSPPGFRQEILDGSSSGAGYPPEPGFRFGTTTGGYPESSTGSFPPYPGYPSGSSGSRQPGYPSAPSSSSQPDYRPYLPQTGAGGRGLQQGGYAFPGGSYQGGPTAHQMGMSSDPRMSGRASIHHFQGFNAMADAETLRKAMKGLGCDNTRVIAILCNRSNAQRQQIATAFKTAYGKDLLKELKSELHGDFEDLILALMEYPARYDAMELRHAMAGLGTRESVLIEIMCSRTNAQILELRQVYRQMYGRELEKDLIGETSGWFKRLLVSLCAAGRDESNYTDHTRANQDARKLLNAGVRRLGTDEACFNAILAAQNYAQLRLVFQEYQKIANHSIEKAIQAEFSGDILDGLMAIVACVQNRNGYFAKLLYDSMVGMGTRDRDLIRLVVSRSEIDLADIREEFQRLYKRSLEAMIKGDCSGAYKDGLIALVRGN